MATLAEDTSRTKEINLLLQRRSLLMPENKLVLMQNNIKEGQSEAKKIKMVDTVVCYLVI